MMDKLDREIGEARARCTSIERDLAAARAYAEGLEKAASLLRLNGHRPASRQKLLPAPSNPPPTEESEEDEFGLIFGETFIRMTEKQALLCEALSEAGGETLSFERLIEAAGIASKPALGQLVMVARRLIQPHGADIVSVKGQGYFWTGPT